MSSPAERFAAARTGARRSSEELARFEEGYPFGLDDFQLEACRVLEGGGGSVHGGAAVRGHSVLVAAPTGAGKTVVGEFACHLALARGLKAFYTTPIKALSNQKYNDLVARHGSDNVGLLTGDNTINGEAPLVVMTTEVLRNMLYAGSSTLDGLGYVVMDEVHYLSDRFRGAVWEEVIIGLPPSVRLVSLSATVSNAEEFGDWLVTVRGDTRVVVEEHRPVPLWQHVLAGPALFDLFVDDDHHQVNPDLVRAAREDQRSVRDAGPRGRGRVRPRGRMWTPGRVEVIERLDAEGLLPAITFIFSRAGCDAAVQACLRSGMRLTTPEERLEVRAHVERRCAELPREDLGVLGYFEWLEALERGIAAHHAGMLPTFKEVVEELFSLGLVRAVFATETLALGINMPARSVVLERLVKWNGEAHADVTAGEYTQLTGRAGRRGIDVEGHAVVLWQPGLDPRAVAGLASTRTYPLRSSFRPSYNMAVNLVGQVGRHTAREMLESSFAQFQADRAVVGMARQLRRNEEALEGYHEAMTCHLGDFAEYSRLRRALSDRDAALARAGATARKAQAAAALEALRPGDVIAVPAGRRPGLAVVLDPGPPSGLDGPRPVVLTADRQVRTLTVLDFPTPVETLDRLRIPRNFNPRNPQQRRDLASTLRARDLQDPPRRRRANGSEPSGEDAEVFRLRRELRAHPCHGCAEREDHARWAERYWRLRKETDQLERAVEGRTNLLARTFDRVCDLLRELSYLERGPGGEDVLTPDGRRLARLYTELDLLAGECLRAGVWDELTPPELAAAVSVLVFEARQADDAAPPRLPAGSVREALGQTVRIWAELEEREKRHGLSFQREPDLGFAWAAYRWASGHRLDVVLRDAELLPGDFVRWVKQLVDLLGQLADAAEPGSPVGRTARKAVDALRRGVVAYSSVG